MPFTLFHWVTEANLEAVWWVYWFYTLRLKRLHVTMDTGLYRGVWLKCTLFRVFRQYGGVDLARNYGYFPHGRPFLRTVWKRDRDTLQRIITDTVISLSLILSFHETWIFACCLLAFNLRLFCSRGSRWCSITRLICKRK